MQPLAPLFGRDRRFGVAAPVTVAEAAALLGVSTLAVYRLIHNHELPATRLGRSVRIHHADLAAYLHSRRLGGRGNRASSNASHRPTLATERPSLRLVSNRA
jgi:excisionase family DNA binding protein